MQRQINSLNFLPGSRIRPPKACHAERAKMFPQLFSGFGVETLDRVPPIEAPHRVSAYFLNR